MGILNVMKSYIFIVISIFLLLPSFVLADIYHWTDKEGVMHITDDMGKVPFEYREKVSVMETDESVKAVKVKDVRSRTKSKGEKAKDPEREIYGDYALTWWRLSFERLRGEIASAQKELDQKEEFISMFRRGRRLGQHINPKNIETFKRYEVEVPLIKERLLKNQKNMNDLRRRARISGVPKEIRK